MTTVLLIIAAVAFTAVLLVGITLTLRSSAAYRLAVQMAVRSPAVLAFVGEPVKPGFLVRGGAKNGVLSLHTRLSGANGSGNWKSAQ
jgi:hypothetical protein